MSFLVLPDSYPSVEAVTIAALPSNSFPDMSSFDPSKTQKQLIIENVNRGGGDFEWRNTATFEKDNVLPPKSFASLINIKYFWKSYEKRMQKEKKYWIIL